MAGQRPLESPVGVRIPAPQQMILNSTLYILFLILIVTPLSAEDHIKEQTITLTVYSAALEGRQVNGISAGIMSVVLTLLPDSLQHRETEPDGLFSSKYSLTYMGAIVLLVFLFLRRIFRKVKIPKINKYSE